MGDLQLTLFAPAEHPLLDEIRRLEVNQLRPLDALALVERVASETGTQGMTNVEAEMSKETASYEGVRHRWPSELPTFVIRVLVIP